MIKVKGQSRGTKGMMIKSNLASDRFSLVFSERRLKSKMGKRESPKRENDTGVSDRGAFKLDHLQSVKLILFPKFSNFYIFMLGSPILITPERGRMKMELSQPE